jgi:SAM-dependent methyltransferase
MRNVVYDPPEKTGKAGRNAALIHSCIEQTILSLRPSSVLEVGSGRGELGRRLSSQGLRYVGVEPVASEMDTARQRLPGLQFVSGSCYDDPATLRLGKFDLVTSNDVIEHLYEPRVLVRFSKAHLNPGGRIVCGTPDYGNYLRNLLLSASNRWDVHHTSLWDGGHIKFFSQRTLGRLWAEAGFVDFQWGFLNYRFCRGFSWYLFCSATLSSPSSAS